jgi:hypothetical protein
MQHDRVETQKQKQSHWASMCVVKQGSRRSMRPRRVKTSSMTGSRRGSGSRGRLRGRVLQQPAGRGCIPVWAKPTDVQTSSMCIVARQDLD